MDIMSESMAAGFSVFGTPLNEETLLASQCSGYSVVIVKQESGEVIPFHEGEITSIRESNPETVADFGHHPLLEAGGHDYPNSRPLGAIPKSKPVDIPPPKRDENYPAIPESTPPTWRGRLNSTWSLNPLNQYERPVAPIGGQIKTEKTSPLSVQLQAPLPQGRERKESFTIPSIVSRVVFALTFLSTPSLKTDLSHIPSTLLGRWKNPIRRLAKKHRVSPTSLSVLENRLIKNHQGFQYLNVFWNINNQVLSRRMIRQGDEVERAMTSESAHYMSNFCLQCEVLHANGADQCTSMFSNGPRILSSLLLDSSSYKFHRAVFVGHVAYYHQPVEFRSIILNLSSNIIRPYYVPNNSDDLSTEPFLPSGLGLYLSSIIQLLGTGSQLPVFVEFFRSPLKPTAHINLHLLGFAKLLKQIQAIHRGPVIMVIPAVMPLAIPAGQDYWTAKKDQLYLSYAANIIGAAVGTPVGLTFMQDLGGAPEGHCFWEDHWTGEPILNERGSPTREFFKRLAYWMRTVIQALQQDAEMPDEMAEQELDLLIRRANGNNRGRCN